MPKRSKVGKQRKDKFYKLAKETGFRSRASFKLIQLNRKFEFLQKSRVLVDLCAAPGGWLQVCQQSMPVSSVIIGVDLVPIRPIANVITLQEDITTDQCRKSLKKELKTWKADAVLHDGAPNVGKSWIHDAFMQNQLTLSALKLATEMLVKGGWFITKVFRSKDYLSLVWAFKKLFKRVHVTKPQASRTESAEIFIVCQGYLAPDHIDPQFLDPTSLFKDVPKAETKLNLDKLAKQKKKAEGYDEDEALYSKLKASEFIFAENHLEKLSKCTEIIFDDEDIRDHKLTTEEIKECCKDVKVLGKGDLRSLMNWRKQLRLTVQDLESEDKKKQEVEVIDEEQEIDDAVKVAEDLELAKLQEAKRKKKKMLKERKKLHERLNLKMVIKDDEPIVEEDRELFSLSQIRNPKELNKVDDEQNLEFSLEPPQNDIGNLFEGAYRSSYAPYNREVKDNLNLEEDTQKEESLYSSDDDLSEDLEFESDDNKSDIVEKTVEILKGKQNPLMVDLVDRPERVKDTIDRWFDKEDFSNDQNAEDLELDLLAEKYEEVQGDDEKKKQKKKSKKKSENLADTGDSENESDQENQADAEVKKDNNKQVSKKRKKRVRLDVEGLALGSLIIQSKKMKRDIIESAYNRYASNDTNLPDWFVEDEKKHYKKQLPVTADMIREYRQKLKEIDARPIKKVVEAKARKKRKAIRRLERAKKQAEKITEHPDMTDKEKVSLLKTIYKKALPKEENRVTYVVAKKSSGPRVSRPAGVKGRYKVVDKRMKKDTRKEKIMAKTDKRNTKKNARKGNARKGNSRKGKSRKGR